MNTQSHKVEQHWPADCPEDGRRSIPATLSITRLRLLGREAGPNYTTAQVHEGQLPDGLPEFGRFATATFYSGLRRGKLYQGIKEGWCKSVSLRKTGQKFSVRLIHIPSLISHLHKLMAEQNPDKA